MRKRIAMPRALCAALLLACVAAPDARAAQGRCEFDRATLAFVGSDAAQARCLLSPVRMYAHLGPPLGTLPPTLAGLVGTPVAVTRAGFRAYLAEAGLGEEAVGGDLDAPVSRTRDGLPARYFVIHDTSSPYLGNGLFPADLDADRGVNSFAAYRAPTDAKAHVFVNRAGDVYLGHDFAVPWRATKLENRFAGVVSRGRFLHVELIQPRRRDPDGGARNDALAPEPGFSAAQYQRLAELYTAASLRTGTWLIPGFHAVIDDGFDDGHDDPQRFDLATWDTSLAAFLEQME